MDVKNYNEAVEAIHNIVFKAKIPVHSMVAILEQEKYQLLSMSMTSQDANEATKFFAALQKETEEKHAKQGVS